MIGDISLTIWVNGGSGLLLVVLGMFIVSITPRRAANLGLAAATGGSGLGFLLNNVGMLFPQGSAAEAWCAYLALPGQRRPRLLWSPGKEQAYRAALRAALRDRVLTRDEEIGLAQLSDELGLSHKRAREIWHEVDAEQRGEAR